MRFALLQLGEDFLSTIVFLVVYLASGQLLLAVGLALAISIAQFAIARARGRAVDVMQWLSLVLDVWAWFISVGVLGAQIVALAVQFVVFRIYVRRRLRAAAR